MTDTDKSRFVATALGLWAAGTRCAVEYSNAARRAFEIAKSTSFCKCGAPYEREHDVPPPNLTSPAGADLLLRTLLERGWKTGQWQSPAGVHFSIETPRKDTRTLDEALTPPREDRGLFEFAVDPNWKVALLDAAYRLLKTDDRKTKEGM
jgi:hypothetical protein